MNKDQVAELVLKIVRELSESDVTVDTHINDVMDSLERTSLAVELNDHFSEANLIEDNDFFRAITVSDLVQVIYRRVS